MPRPAAGFGRSLKLLDGHQFRRVFNQKRPVHGKYFGIYSSPNRLCHPRVGLAVSKKVSKKAVQRNRIKRQIRETFRLLQHTLGGTDLVVVAKAGCAEQESRILRYELNKLWQRIGQKCENRARQ